jgi:hypothetical protein
VFSHFTTSACPTIRRAACARERLIVPGQSVSCVMARVVIDRSAAASAAARLTSAYSWFEMPDYKFLHSTDVDALSRDGKVRISLLSH